MTLWAVAHQAPLSMGVFRQKLEWVACPPPGDLPDPETEPTSLASPSVAGGFFTSRASFLLFASVGKENVRKRQQ